MREFLEIVRSLVRPAGGFLAMLFTGRFGWRPLVALACQIALQIAVVHMFPLTAVGAVAVTGVLTVLLALGAFRVFAVGLGLAFAADQAKNNPNSEWAVWRYFAIYGYLMAVIPALLSCGVVLGITGYCTGAGVGRIVSAIALSVFGGSVIDVVGVLVPMYHALHSDRKN